MEGKTRVIMYGLGPIGSSVARLVLERSNLELVGGVDIDPAKVGKDIGQVVGADRTIGLTVKDKLSGVLEKMKADVVLHTTNSYFDLFMPEILGILEAGLDIVSTSEELSFPWLTHPKEAAEIDAIAKKAGKSVLATGVNPGFLMDSLPLYLTSICRRIDHIEVRRIQNASKRRGPFQAKIGSGMTVEEFRKKMDSGRMGHVGLVESTGMLFNTLGKKLARFETQIEPIVAEKLISTPYFNVPPGRVIGLKQVAHGYTDHEEFLTLVFIAALESPEDQDTISITGEPNLTVALQGTNGDIATSAIAVNAIQRVRVSAPGLLTMRDLPIVVLS
jgi:hypothetical protein